MRYGIMILAAGNSSRMGTSKQLLTINNQSLLRKTINTTLALAPTNCTVVLGANFTEHANEIRSLPVDIIENPNWRNGMGSSIKAGIKNLKKYSLDAFYILVCDQPYLTSAHLKNLAVNYELSKALIVASGYNDTKGVPALFDWSMSVPLLELPDNGGAKQIILKNCQQVVEFVGGEIDLDTLEDYQNFKERDQ